MHEIDLCFRGTFADTFSYAAIFIKKVEEKNVFASKDNF